MVKGETKTREKSCMRVVVFLLWVFLINVVNVKLPTISKQTL